MKIMRIINAVMVFFACCMLIFVVGSHLNIQAAKKASADMREAQRKRYSGDFIASGSGRLEYPYFLGNDIRFSDGNGAGGIVTSKTKIIINDKVGEKKDLIRLSEKQVRVDYFLKGHWRETRDTFERLVDEISLIKD